MEPVEAETVGRNQYGVVKLQHTSSAARGDAGTTSPGTSKYTGYSFANPVYEPGGAPPILPVTATTVGSTPGTGPGPVVVDEATGSTHPTVPSSGCATGPTYKVEDVIIRGSGRGLRPTLRVRAFDGFKRGLEARWNVARAIWPYMVSIALAYFVTLCLYPGIESEITSCKYGSWMGVILMAIFNASDLLGKVIASVPYEWSRQQLVVFAAARLPLVPLLLMCAIPRGHPIMMSHEYNAMMLSMIIGLTNGMVGSIPMIQAPSRVPEERRELAGNIMTLSYNFGLTTGSLVAYLLDTAIGSPKEDGCTTMPHYISISSTMMTPSITTNGTLPLLNLTNTVAKTLSTMAASFSSTSLSRTEFTALSTLSTNVSLISTNPIVSTAATILNSTATILNATRNTNV